MQLTGYGVQNLTEWTVKFKEVEQKVEALAFCPSKKTFEALSESQAQLESALKEEIGKRQKNRAEVLDAIDEYVDQLKQTQNNVNDIFYEKQGFILPPLPSSFPLK